MNKIINVFNNCPVVFASTVDMNGKPKNRPVALAMVNNETMYFSTSTETSIFSDLQRNPFICFTAMIDQQSWFTLDAEITFVDDMVIKEMIISNNQVLSMHFQTANNPIFIVFKLMTGTAKFYDYSGNAPMEYKF